MPIIFRYVLYIPRTGSGPSPTSTRLHVVENKFVLLIQSLTKLSHLLSN